MLLKILQLLTLFLLNYLPWSSFFGLLLLFLQNTLEHFSMLSNMAGRNVKYTNRLEHATSTGIIL